MPSSPRTSRTASGAVRPLRTKKTDKRLQTSTVRSGKTFSKKGKSYTVTAFNADGGTGVDIMHKGKVIGGTWYGRGLKTGAGAESRRQTKAMSSYAKNYFKKNSK